MYLKETEEIKKRYPTGTKIVLDRMGEDPHPVGPGTKGTVRFVDDIGTVHVAFENGRQMGLIIGEDTFHIEEEKEIQSTEDPYRQRDGFWIYPNEKLAEEIYYNPDSVNGGQIVRNYITFSQIRNADVFAKGDPERFFLYLDTVCRQELQDLDPGGEDVEAALDALFGEPDLCGTTKETMDALYASAKASVTKEKAAPKMSGPER